VKGSLPLWLNFVSIPQWCDCCSIDGDMYWNGGSFNPTMVRLLQNGSLRGTPNSIGFNPTMVRLLLAEDGMEFSLKRSFNPTMVRLLLNQGKNSPSATCKFQSHNGAIAASLPRHNNSLTCWQFQSHNGAIAAPQQLFTVGCILSFNPTMVRLLLPPCRKSPSEANFVSIPQWCDCCQMTSFAKLEA